MNESTITQRVLRRVLLPLVGQLFRGFFALIRWSLVLLRAITSLVRWFVRLWPSKTQVLVIVATALPLLRAFGIVTVVIIHGFAPETAALLVAWATIVGVVTTQIVSAKVATDRAQDDTLRAYLEKMGDLLTTKGIPKPTDLANQSKDEARASARAYTLVILRKLNRRSRYICLHFLYESGLIKRGNSTMSTTKNGREMRRENPIVSLRDGHLRRTHLHSSHLHGADLSEADLFLANLRKAELNEARLARAHMSGANLREAQLREAHLGEAVLFGAHLRQAVLSDSILIDVKLNYSSLRGSNLSSADLSGADFRFCNLRRATLSDADLSDAGLSNANLSGANLSSANLSSADLRGVNLTKTRNLTQKQIEQAIGDPNTQLPDGLKLPAVWKRIADEQQSSDA